MDPEAFDDFIRRRDKTGDDARPMAVAKRHDNGSRTARKPGGPGPGCGV